MWGEAIKWVVVAGVAVVVTAGAACVLYNWDVLVLNVVAPWARKNHHQGLLVFLVQVDRRVLGLRRVVVRFAGRSGEAQAATPLLVVDRVLREADLPPELRPLGEHQWTLNVES